jgi:hypothetical protein
MVQEYFNESEQVEEVEEDLNAFHLKSNRRKPEHKITFRESSIQHQLPRPSDKLFFFFFGEAHSFRNRWNLSPNRLTRQRISQATNRPKAPSYWAAEINRPWKRWI